jgi:hypothetical protein
VSPRKLVVLSGVVALLFAFIFFFERKMPTTAELERKGELYWDIPEDRLERITLKRGPEVVEFQKTETAPWRMIKPDSYPADVFAVNGLASDLAELKRAGGGTPAEASAAEYGLEKPTVKASFVWTDAGDPKERKTRTIEFGITIPGTDTVAARLEGASRIFFVPSSVLTAVKKSVDDFRSREVFGGTSGDFVRLEILRGRGRLLLTRKEGFWWLAEPVADLADSAEADRLVGQLTALRAQDFVHGTDDLASLSLNPPLYRVTVTGVKGAVASVDFGATRSDGNTIYARREGQVFTVDRDITDELSKEAVAFRSASLVALNRSEVVSLEASFGDAHFALSQKDGGWTSQGRPVLASGADDVLTAILDAKSKSFLDAADVKGLGPAPSTVTVRMKTGPPWTVSFHTQADRTIAVVSPRPGGFLVDGNAPGKLEAAFRKALATPTPSPTKGKS